jgi:hypothetical protein
MTEAFENQMAGGIRLVKVIETVTGSPGSFPNTTSPCYYRCQPVTVENKPALNLLAGNGNADMEGNAVNYTVHTDPDRNIFVANFRKNTVVLGGLYLAFRLSNGSYVLDNQMAFLENQ